MGTCSEAFYKHWILFPTVWHLPRLSQGRTREAKMCVRLSWRSQMLPPAKRVKATTYRCDSREVAKFCLRLIAETDARSVGDSHPSCNICQGTPTNTELNLSLPLHNHGNASRRTLRSAGTWYQLLNCPRSPAGPSRYQGLECGTTYTGRHCRCTTTHGFTQSSKRLSL